MASVKKGKKNEKRLLNLIIMHQQLVQSYCNVTGIKPIAKLDNNASARLNFFGGC